MYKTHSSLPRIRENSCAYYTVVDHDKKEELKWNCYWKNVALRQMWNEEEEEGKVAATTLKQVIIVLVQVLLVIYTVELFACKTKKLNTHLLRHPLFLLPHYSALYGMWNERFMGWAICIVCAKQYYVDQNIAKPCRCIETSKFEGRNKLRQNWSEKGEWRKIKRQPKTSARSISMPNIFEGVLHLTIQHYYYCCIQSLILKKMHLNQKSIE